MILINLSDFGCTEAYWHLGLEGEGAWIEQQADGDAGGESKKCVVVEDTEVMQPLNWYNPIYWINNIFGDNNI